MDLSMDFDETVTDDVEVGIVNDSFIDVIDQANTHDTQIEVDSKFVYEAFILRSLFSGDMMSKDCLRRVQGMTRTNKCFGSDDLNIDNMIMVGDLILVTTERCELQIAIIMGMSQAKKKERRIPFGRLSDKNVQVDVKIMFIDLQEGSNWYAWNGEYIGTQFKSDGSKVFTICPELREVSGEFMYSFEHQVILDMGYVVNLCGFCGGIACSNRLEVSSSKGGDAFYKYVSNCQYKVDIKRKPKFSVCCIMYQPYAEMYAPRYRGPSIQK